MLLMWGLIIIICSLCGAENPLYFGVGFCIGYIIRSLVGKGYEIIVETALTALEKELKDNEEEKEKEDEDK